MEETKSAGGAGASGAGADGLATSGRWWVTAPDAVAPERPSAPGDGAPRLTVMEVFDTTVATHGDKAALKWMDVPKNVEGPAREAAIRGKAWSQWTWKEYYEQCMQFARALVAIGFRAHATVNILGFNHRRWAVADLGCIAAGGMAAGIYTTNKPESVAYIVDHSECQVGVVENNVQLAKFKYLVDHPELGKQLKYLVVYNDVVDPEVKAALASRFVVYSWMEFMALGDAKFRRDVDARIRAQVPGHCCTLIYTSGTTGPPKAVMVSHDNVTWTAAAALNNIFQVGVDDRIMSYLPLSHIAGQMLDLHAPMAGGATTYFADVSVFKGMMVPYLHRVLPTIFFGVPRVWEKLEAGVKAKGKAAAKTMKPIVLKLAQWAKRQGKAMTKSIEYGKSGRQPFLYGLAYKLVLSKVHAALGLTHARILATGAAPIGKATLEFFSNYSMPIYEVFGQSECTGPQTVNYPNPDGFAGMYKIGSTGPALPHTVLAVVPDPLNKPLDRIPQGEGEIVYSGRHIMMGYMKNPKKTREAIDPDGFLHSGDKGLIDADGFLRITGRYKELIIGAGGENIAPVIIEQTFKEECDAISNFVVYGDQQKFLVALVTLQTVEDPETRLPTDTLAPITTDFGRDHGCNATTATGVVSDPEELGRWMTALKGVMARANKKAVSNAATVKYITILPQDFRVGTELTDTMKLKRAVVYNMYMDVIKKMYTDVNAWRDV